MFGLWYAVIGLVFGSLCSFKAKGKNRTQKEWFILGFIFSILGYMLLHLLPNKKETLTA